MKRPPPVMVAAAWEALASYEALGEALADRDFGRARKILAEHSERVRRRRRERLAEQLRARSGQRGRAL